MPRVSRLERQQREMEQRRQSETALVDEGEDLPVEIGQGGAIVADPEVGGGVEQPLYPARAQDEDFFDYIEALPASAWGEDLSLYLYRLEPRVENAPGEKKYIQFYVQPVTPEIIKAAHGGGRYKLILKSKQKRNRLLPDYDFWIDGEPLFKPGQTIKGQPAVAQVTAQPNPGAAGPIVDVSDLMRQVIDAVRQNKDKSPDEIAAAIEGIRQANRISLELVGEAAKSQIQQNGPKDPVAQFKEMLALVQMLTPKPAEQKSMVEQLRELAELKKLLAPEQATSWVSELKELFGDNLQDVLSEFMSGGRKRGGNDSLYGELISLGKTALDRAPQLIAQLKSGAAPGARPQQHPGQPALPPAPAMFNTPGTGVPMPSPDAIPPAPGPSLVPPQQPTPAVAPAGEVTMDMVEQAALNIVVQSFNAGDDGATAAICLKRAYPELLPIIQQKLHRVPLAMVMMWAKQHAILGAIAGQEDAADFLQQFTAEILRDEDADDEPGPEVTPPAV